MTERDHEFDELARTLSTTTSRRHALKIFGVATAGGVASLFGAGSAKAAGRCFQGGHGCRRNEECCSGFCDPSTARCGCGPGTFMCTSTGICVGPCAPGKVFNAATCQCECPAGTIPVNGTCCTNPIGCGSSSDCCPGFRCDPKTGRCIPCTNPVQCKSSSECCSGYVCADNPIGAGNVCVPAQFVP